MKKLYLFMAISAVVLAGILAVGCGGGPTATTSSNSSGSTPASSSKTNYKDVPVKDVATNPQAYDGQDIRVQGNYAVGYCSACFLLKDGVSALRIEVSDTAPLPPEDKLGARMEVSGKIYIAQDSPNLIADEIVYK